jgi:hypothetical protein
MSNTEHFTSKGKIDFRADLGDYREIKVKGIVEGVHGVRIDSGKVWDLDHFIPHALSLDGFVIVPKQRILAKLNEDRYDKVNFLFSLGEMPEWPEVFPALDTDRQLFEWIRDERKLVMVFLQGRRHSFIGLVEGVGDKTCGIRLISDELVLADELVVQAYDKINALVVDTSLLQMFYKYLEATEQVYTGA